MSERESLRSIALRVERAVGLLEPNAIMRTSSGAPMQAVGNPQSTVKVTGYVTAGDLYEIAWAVLSSGIERKGKEGENYEA